MNKPTHFLQQLINNNNLSDFFFSVFKHLTKKKKEKEKIPCHNMKLVFSSDQFQNLIIEDFE